MSNHIFHLVTKVVEDTVPPNHQDVLLVLHQRASESVENLLLQQIELLLAVPGQFLYFLCGHTVYLLLAFLITTTILYFDFLLLSL